MSKTMDALRAMSGDKKSKDAHLIYAQLIADGFTPEEVLPYLIHKPSAKYKEDAKLAAISWSALVPWFDALVGKIVSKNPTVRTPVVEESDNIDDLDTSSKESVIKHLKKQYKNTDDPKQKSDILMKIAELQKMKQDEIKEEKKHTMVYLPATCHSCPCLLEVQKEHPDIKPLSQC